MNYFKNLSISDRSALENALRLILENEWEKAHEIAQSKEGNPAYDRIHALLHRIEGDDFNARYWYRRIGVSKPKSSTTEETKELLQQLLEN